MEIMRFGYETSSKIIGFKMENIRFGYETPSKIIRFKMENIRIGYEASSKKNDWIYMGKHEVLV